MDVQTFREELNAFYWEQIDSMADDFREKVFAILDGECTPEMNGYQRKALQYEVIARECQPVLLHSSPFYHELGTISKLCDGCGTFHGKIHAGAWNYRRSEHLFRDKDPELFELCEKQRGNLLYLICGPYADTQQHFLFNCKPLFRAGLKGLYQQAEAQLAVCKTDDERDFLQSAMTGLLSLKQISEKFALLAERRIAGCTDAEEARRLERIRDAASYTPWNAPRTFYEALNCLAFIRTACGALEGIGYNTFGRPDVELLPFYQADIAAGRLDREAAYNLVLAFLLTWDCHYDHDMKMAGYSDHELENTYTLGGCDEYGQPVWNDLTEMFIRATKEQKIIFPKISIRYGANSPKAYLDAVDEDVIRGTSSVLFENDDACIPALVHSGRSVTDARDYLVSGCWSLLTNGDIMDDHGNYVNLLKPFEFALHRRFDKMDECGLQFETYDGARSFEEVYDITLRNCRVLLRERNRMTLEGKSTWPAADPLPLTSASMVGCLESKKDLTNGGCKYHDEEYMFVGFPNIVDSLLAIKTLCTLCGACARYCPQEARKVCGKSYTPAEALSIITADKAFYDTSGGGATFSGGECMLQLEFLEAILALCKENGIHTAVDTAGDVPFSSFEKILPYTDLFLYDIKGFDSQTHRQFTGVGNERILANLASLLSLGRSVWVRVPVVPGVNDTEAEMVAILGYLLRCGYPEKVELLPYHRMGEAKYSAMHREAARFDVPDESHMARLRAAIAK